MKFLAEERSHYQRETKSLLLNKEAQDHTEEKSQSEDINKNNGYNRNKI